jgi:DNA-binding CsgD family transcriptional regulator
MTKAVTHAILCPTIIGREAQRAAIASLLARARGGEGQTLLIAGEAGVGKSRLAADLVQRTVADGVGVLVARAFEADSAIPCALLADLLRCYMSWRPSGEFVQEFGPGAAQLIQLLPELRTQRADSAASSPTAAEADKRLLFESLIHLLLSEPAPAVILVEDAHWCDLTSLDFLLFLARRIATHSLLLVITYRHNETNAALARFLAALDREHLAVEVQLAPLTKTQTEAMLRAIFTLSQPVQDDFLDALYTLTEGNPFFVEEVLKSCVAAGDIFQVGGQWGRKLLSELHIPRSVQVAVQQRVEQLTTSAQALLKVAAVIGQRFEFTLLQQISGHDETTLLRVIRELMAAQLVVEEREDHFAFRHALTRQAVYFTLLSRERRTLHAKVARNLEAMPIIAAPALAYHFYLAKDWSKTWEYARRAGEEAVRLYAPRAAIEHLSNALEAATHLRVQDDSDRTKYDIAPIYATRGTAYETLGRFEAAQADFEQLLTLARRNHDARAEWHSQLNLGFLWTSRDFDRAEEHYQQALVVARTLHEPALLAQSLNRVGNWYVNNEQPGLGERYHDEALAIFQQLDDRAGRAATLDLLAGATLLAGAPQRSLTYFGQAIALFRDLHEQRGLASCLAWLAIRGQVAINLLTPTTPLAAGADAAQEALGLTRDIQWRAGETFAMCALAFTRAAQGEYGEALALAESAAQLAQEIDHRWDTVGLIVLGTTCLDLGITTHAQEYLERARAIGEGHHILFSLRISSSFLALTHLAQGQTAAAHSVLRSVFVEAPDATPGRATATPTLAERLGWYSRAQLALHEARAGDALAIANFLLATTGAIDASPDHGVPPLLKLRADALLALNRLGEAEATLQSALDAATALGAKSQLWRIHLTLAYLRRQQGDHMAAAVHIGAARAGIVALAATIPNTVMRQQFEAYTHAKLPPPPTLTPRRAKKQRAEGLTVREVEVAQLIQQGKSDRDIADALSLSKRTVSTHVSNILTKLNFRARSQIAAWVATKDLT